MRHATLPCLALLLFSVLPQAFAEETPPGWTTTVKRLEGSQRRLWYLALVTHESSRHVTLVVAPVSAAGTEGAGVDGENIDRSESGDLHQIARWAEQLRKEAEGWKRPSLRDRPPASPHVIGVVRSVASGTTVENAEHGGGRVRVGDLLFVEDVLSLAREGVVGVELLGPEDKWHHRWTKAELVFAHGARVGLRGSSEALSVHLHQGAVLGAAWTDDLRVRTPEVICAPDKEARFYVSGAVERGESAGQVPAIQRVDVRSGLVLVEREDAKTSVAAGSTLSIAPDGTLRITPLAGASWDRSVPQETPCARDEALRLVARVHGHWRGQPLNASITLGDDGRWRSYERQPGRSVNKGGAWEPRPGGLLELSYVWTPYRSKTQKTDTFRYLLDGNALVRLRPGGQVFLKQPLRK